MFARIKEERMYKMRKKLLSLLLVLILLLSPAFPAMAAGDEGSSPTILIAYFSWAGHTKQIAEEIYAQVGGVICLCRCSHFWRSIHLQEKL